MRGRIVNYKKIIRKRYSEKGLTIDRVVKSKLNDGFFVYHKYGAPKRYKKYKNTRIDNTTTYREVRTVLTNVDFIDMGDLFEISISISLEQALNRAGKT